MDIRTSHRGNDDFKTLPRPLERTSSLRAILEAVLIEPKTLLIPTSSSEAKPVIEPRRDARTGRGLPERFIVMSYGRTWGGRNILLEL